MTQAAAETTQIPGATLPPRFGRFIGGLRDNPPGRMLRYLTRQQAVRDQSS